MNGHTYPYTDVLPPFPQLWARWASIAAAFAAARIRRGPRMLPLLAWFESAVHDGSVLHALPGGQAVLWGEIGTPQAAGIHHPDGPTNPISRSDSPLPSARPATDVDVISFGYRWEADRWHPLGPPAPGRYTAALPGIWSTDETVDAITALAAGGLDEGQRAAAVTMVCAAEIGTVTRAVVTDVFGDQGLFDIDSAMNQFAMAGALGPQPGALFDGFPSAAVSDPSSAAALARLRPLATLSGCYGGSTSRVIVAGRTWTLRNPTRCGRPL